MPLGAEYGERVSTINFFKVVLPVEESANGNYTYLLDSWYVFPREIRLFAKGKNCYVFNPSSGKYEKEARFMAGSPKLLLISENPKALFPEKPSNATETSPYIPKDFKEEYSISQNFPLNLVVNLVL